MDEDPSPGFPWRAMTSLVVWIVAITIFVANGPTWLGCLCAFVGWLIMAAP